MPFCDEEVTEDVMEFHVTVRHGHMANESLSSEIQAHIAGLLGMKLEVKEERLWSCIFPGCRKGFDTFTERKRHIETEHAKYVGQLYQEIGGFWTAMIVAAKEDR
jgi:hypothetical protein